MRLSRSVWLVFGAGVLLHLSIGCQKQQSPDPAPLKPSGNAATGVSTGTTNTETGTPPGTPTGAPPGTPTGAPPGTPTGAPPGTPAGAPSGSLIGAPPGTPGAVNSGAVHDDHRFSPDERIMEEPPPAKLQQRMQEKSPGGM